MSVYSNPFYLRSAEQFRDAPQFVMNFGPGALDMLPNDPWDRLVLLRSSPGAGKTSLMRLFTVENLDWALRRTKQSDPLLTQLAEVGAVADGQPTKLGVLVDLDRDYRSLLDLPFSPEETRRLFLRLLDVRILVGVIQGALAHAELSYPDDVDRVSLSVNAGDARAESLVERIGGPTGTGILEYARATERTVLRLLDALYAADVDSAPSGHNELYSLSVLAEGHLQIDGTRVALQPLLMFDDGHKLDDFQRTVLLDELRLRRTSVARWYAERFEALSNQELLSDVGEEDRDVALVVLDSIARWGDGKRFTRGRHDRILEDIARRRAAPQLTTYATESHEFLQLLDNDREVAPPDRLQEVVATTRQRTTDLSRGESRYAAWLSAAEELEGFDAAIRWRELEVLIHRDLNRQQDLFGEALTASDMADRTSAALREGAAVSLAQEFNLPYFAGGQPVVRLGSHNTRQFLRVCGDLFAEMLVDISLGRPPRLSAARQNRVLYKASRSLWDSIPRTVPNGRDVQRLVLAIEKIANAENRKPTMPYPPGVTGTALLMSERQLLLDPDFRERTPGAERLFNALAAAVSHNVLTADLDYSVKGSRYMVLYLNRLLCPRFGLPLGYGGFKERKLSVMLGWLQTREPSGAAIASDEGRLDL